MYINLYDTVMLVDFVQEKSNFIILSHPMMYVIFTLNWTAP